MDKKAYTSEGFLIVTETDSCPLWEKDPIPCGTICSKDCFFCKFSDFRTKEFRIKAEQMSNTGLLYSVCKNENNKNKESNK